MPGRARDLADRLAREAEAVCRHYLSNGRRDGRTWRVGDVNNSQGGSLCVRLTGEAGSAGAAGKWSDFATGEHGDLLDLIAAALGTDIRGAMDEADRFLGFSPTARIHPPRSVDGAQTEPLTPARSCALARRLFAAARPIQNTMAARYLQSRHLAVPAGSTPLRFLPDCRYRAAPHGQDDSWPALLAAVTDAAGTITGVQRIYLARNGSAKAPVHDPCRSLGRIHGRAVRFGTGRDLLAVGEGVETMLSLRSVLPGLPVAATLSASHLAAFVWPARLRTLLIASDNDPAGWNAAERLRVRAAAAGITTARLDPVLGDWNDDLRELGLDATTVRLRRLKGAALPQQSTAVHRALASLADR